MYRDDGIDDYDGYTEADSYDHMNEMAATDLLEARNIIAELEKLRLRASQMNHTDAGEDLPDMIEEAMNEAARITRHAERAWMADGGVDDVRENGTLHAVYQFGHAGAA